MALAQSMSERKRVKVYELRENDWYDRGTGFCTAQSIQDEARISVESEEDAERLLLDVHIKREDAYQKQQDTLIVWTDPDGVDMALSFQEAEGCGFVWTSINDVQQRISDGQDDSLNASLALPPAELGNLGHIEDVVRRANATQAGRDALSKMIINDNYIASLTPLVEMAEDLESLHDLHRLCNIMKTLILFNDTPIIEYVVSSEIILGVVGALEYDPDFPTHKANHRQYLSDPTKFKEVVHIEDPDIRKKIHSTYRLQYLKDVVLARILDDPTFSVLNSLIFFLQVDIVQHIQGNTSFLTELFAILTSKTADQHKKKDAVLFIQQSCAISKSLQAATRAHLYSNFISCGLFQTITYALQHHDSALRVAGTDILVAVIDHDVILMRSFIAKSITDKQKPMLNTLVELLLVETDLGVKAQIADALKVLLDANTAGNMLDRPVGPDTSPFARTRGNAVALAQTDQFLQYFYDVSAKTLFTPLKNLEHRESLNDLTFHEVSTFSHLVEILCFFLRQHHYRSKYFILSEGLHSRVAQLLTCPEKHLKLVAIKYFRTCIGIQDEFHLRQIKDHRLLEPVLNLIIATMPRDNLLNSACLELFEYIRREGLKSLIIDIVEKYRDRLVSITYVDVFHGLLRRYDQLMNPGPPPEAQNREEGADSSFMTSEADTPNTRHITINGGAQRWSQGLKEPDPEEDAYFNTSDNEDDDEDELSRDEPPTLPGAMSNGFRPSPMKPLVDYGDDEDDDLAAHVRAERPQPAKTALPREKSLDSTSSPTSAHSNALSTPLSTPSPPTSIPEKRPRDAEDDEDDDDELGKLSAGRKRRSSDRQHRRIAAESGSASETADETAAGPAVEVDHPEDSATSGTAQRQPLRRTRSNNAGKEGPAAATQTQTQNGKNAGAGAGAGRKIAISLGGAGAKTDNVGKEGS
ncbi:MAG: Platinum sensitivity protein [Chrysothrix sp. TS-e1954]|nr:MAG: Platinum sensitivity protein [Chrysothrix sp. TS-e1954]